MTIEEAILELIDRRPHFSIELLTPTSYGAGFLAGYEDCIDTLKSIAEENKS